MADKTARPKLVLKRQDLRKNTAILFEQLAKDKTAREEFIQNPVGQVVAKLTKQPLPRQHISDANRVLFAMMANEKFRKWLDEYEAQPGGKAVTQEQFGRDFAEALLKFGDSDLIRAVFKYASDGFGMPGFTDVAQQLITGPDKSAITSPATPSTSDKTLKSSQNFNNKSTGFQFGDAFHVDPAFMRSMVEHLITHAQELKKSGKLADVNTQFG
jgi:hypothetical protein